MAQGIRAKDHTWDLTAAEPAAHEVATVAIGLDGACLLFCEEGYRQAMAGTIALYNAAGERLHVAKVAWRKWGQTRYGRAKIKYQ